MTLLPADVFILDPAQAAAVDAYENAIPMAR
jgi:hypothetical protein